MLQDLQNRYPRAVVRVETGEPLTDTKMDESQFWQIIQSLDWKQTENARVIAPAIEALSQYPIADIAAFDDLLSQKLYALDGQRYAEQTGDRAYSNNPDQHFSVDGFLYARCCVVANGKEFYEKVLQDPTLMPKNYTFEPLLYLAEKDYRTQTGRNDYDHVPEVWSETFSNADGWPGRTTVKDRILAR